MILRKETPNLTRYKLKPEYKNLLMAIQALPGVLYHIFRPFQEGDSEQDIIDECKSLNDNMMYHFNHETFMREFNMNKEEYHLVDEVAFDRRVKIENLGL